MVSQFLQPKSPMQFELAEEPINKDDFFLYHKTTNRATYSYFQKKYPHVFDVLLWNENHELTEFTNGNVVLEIDGGYFTPPIHCGLLAGTFREKLILEGTVQERILTFEDLKKCNKVWFINSVRQWVEVQQK